MAFFENSLYKAIVEGDCKELKDFLKRGLSPDYAFKSADRSGTLGKTLLSVAVENGQHDLARVLIGQGCDPYLSYVVDVADYKPILRKYEGRQRLKWTCLYRCLVKDDVKMVQILVSGGSDVNLEDERGCTPIWHAVDLNNYDIAKAIASNATCDVNIHDVTHLYPLHVASIHANVKMASLLIRKCARIDVLTARGSTPLILACKSACYDVVRLFLLNGANPNHSGINGHTPISAVLENCPDTRILYLLIESGARIDLADVKKCVKDKLPLLKSCPQVLDILKELASIPTGLKMLCCLAIRKALLASHSNKHLVLKVQTLPLPNIINEFLLLNHL